MAHNTLESGALSAFFDSVAVMLSAGIQTDEAVYLLAENMQDDTLRTAYDKVYRQLIAGCTLADAMKSYEAFPHHAVDMVRTGEETGRLENVLRNLASYYDEEDRLFNKIRTSVGYPAALLCVMSVILAFSVIVILPVFNDVYTNLAGSLTAASSGAMDASIAIGVLALIITLFATAGALIALRSCRTSHGRNRLLKNLEHFSVSRDALYQMALSRFMAALSTYVASGVHDEDAMKAAMETVTNPELREELDDAYRQMIDLEKPKSLAQAFYDTEILEPIYARLLLIGSRTGSLDGTLRDISATYFDDAIDQIDRLVDAIEPLLAAFMTIAVGATLISVMLPLIGIMGSIG